MKEAIAALALMWAFGAQAQTMTTYSTDLSGSYTQVFDDYSCDPEPHCEGDAHSITGPWSGTIAATVDGEGDGTFAADSLPSLAFATNLASFTTSGNGGGVFALMSASVTIQDGQIEALRFLAYLDPYTTLSVGGTQATYTFSGAHHGGYADGMATIGQSLIAPIPEPSEWALLLAGLGLMAIAGRRRRARGAG